MEKNVEKSSFSCRNVHCNNKVKTLKLNHTKTHVFGICISKKKEGVGYEKENNKHIACA